MTQNVTLKEARETINHLVQGIDPYTGEVLSEVAFLQNPRMIRCFAVMSELLTRIIEKKDSEHEKRADFFITMDEAAAIKFPTGDVGVKAIVDTINRSISNPERSPLTVQALYGKLKEMNILRRSTSAGRTIATEASESVGIITVKSTYQGEEYDRILYTEKAKVFLIGMLPGWFPEDR